VENLGNTTFPREKFLFFKVDGPVSGGRPVEDSAVEEVNKSGEAICCKTCGLPVTSRKQEVSINSSHTHTFFNPAGIVFELGLFKKAPGCMLAGESSFEFTWFAGYSWSFSLCRGCQSHLGWFYSNGENSFFGLILRNLVYPFEV